MEDVRKLPKILNSKKASEIFLKEDSKAAIKILAVEELSSNSLKDIPYELLANELIKRMDNFEIKEINLLCFDADYADKLKSLRNVVDEVQFILSEIDSKRRQYE